MANAPNKKKPRRTAGRPPKGPYAEKRKTLSTRITEGLRLDLEKAAKSTGRSLSQEIEFRLEQSFISEQAKFSEFGGEANYKKFRTFAGVADLVSEVAGKDWDQNPDSWAKATWLMYETVNLTNIEIKPFDFKRPKKSSNEWNELNNFLANLIQVTEQED
ncbi:MAG: hypothetical protein HOC57_09915 [Rhodospirillaceae bacterium]|jgi:hypothetical protein|nr:hypothetical protein [Rhodospirillaceae bacterium]